MRIIDKSNPDWYKLVPDRILEAIFFAFENKCDDRQANELTFAVRAAIEKINQHPQKDRASSGILSTAYSWDFLSRLRKEQAILYLEKTILQSLLPEEANYLNKKINQLKE